MNATNERTMLIEHFRRTLAAAQVHRQTMRDMVDTDCGPELGWVAFEKDAMLKAVNIERYTRGLPSITRAQITRVENSACGHIDYSAKFAMYCADLVLGGSRA